MSVLLDDQPWKNNPWYREYGPESSDYTGFYVAISLCTLLGVTLIVFNFILCCCSPYKNYWRDPHTGNRWLLPIFISSPKQPPLTLQPEISESRYLENV